MPSGDDQSKGSEQQLLTENVCGHERSNSEYFLTMAWPRRKFLRWLKGFVAISVLLVILILIKLRYFGQTSVFGFSIFVPSSSTYRIGGFVEYRASQNLLTFSHKVSGASLLIKAVAENLGASNVTRYGTGCMELESTLESAKKSVKDGGTTGFERHKDSLCLEWKDEVQLFLNESETGRCYTVRWSTPWTYERLENCIEMKLGHWYGGSSLHEQQWPLEDVSIPMQPFIASPLVASVGSAGEERYGPVLERFWFNSQGFAVVVDRAVPLHVSVRAAGDQQLCLRAQYDEVVYKADPATPLVLAYTVCQEASVKQVHRHVMTSLFQLPKVVPNKRLFLSPVWSTRGVNLRNLTQSQVLSLQQSIATNKLPHGQLLIIGNYTRRVGSLFFDFDRFPNGHQMVSEMRMGGFNVSTSVSPCIQIDNTSLEYKEGEKMAVFITTANGKVLKSRWEGMECALVDLTNPAARKWMESRLHNIRLEAAIESFYFDSANIASQPSEGKTFSPTSSPSDYVSHYLDFVHSLGDKNVIVNAGYATQHLGLWTDAGMRLSTWDHRRGLKSIIPTVLTLGLLGYPFLMTGPAGGVTSAYDYASNAMELPDRELYIRWLQLVAFLPGVELSVGPWQYDKPVLDMTLQLLNFRLKYVFPILAASAQEHINTGAPLIRPVWWIAEDDETAQRIDCEFLVGDKMLLAPVLDADARSRDIYLPTIHPAHWYSKLTGKIYKGGQWLRNFPVDLYQVAVFMITA